MADQEQKCPECKEGAPEYMLTYGDMMTLLLCFFVLLLSMANMDVKKFDVAASSFQKALNGVLESMPTVAIQPEVMTPRLGGMEQNKRMAAEVARTMREVMEQQEKKELEDAIKVEVTDEGIAIKVSDPVGFEPGRAELKPEFTQVLGQMLEATRKLENKQIRVEGHTDDIPIQSFRYPTNWELSSARAAQVVKFLHNSGEDPTRLSAVGYGEYRPVVPNTSAENRRKNRRIEVYVDFLEKEESE